MSTPSPVLFAAHRAALEIFIDAGVTNVFEKNRRLNHYLWFILNEIKKQTPDDFLKILTPADEEKRGCQVSLAIKNGKQVFNELSGKGIYADWREPDVVRIAPVGLYNTFEEVWQFGQLLKTAINNYSA